MRRLMAAVAAITLTAATAAAAEDWQPADMSTNTLVGVEVSSIRGDARIRTATVMLVYDRTGPGGVDFMVVAAGFDCATHTVAAIRNLYYSADGTLLLSEGDVESAADSPIERGSLMQSVEEMVCSGRRDPAGISDGIEFAATARRLLLEGDRR